ncbi:MAG: polysaccharide deacetylase family protein [Bdellovibrionota bacterium]
MFKYLILSVLLAYSQYSNALIANDIRSGLEAARTFHEYIEETVEPGIVKTLKKYKENPLEFCESLSHMSDNELIYLNDVIDGIRSEVPCAVPVSQRISDFYENYRNGSIYRIKINSLIKLLPLAKMESAKIILDKAYSLPAEKQLPAKVINLTFDDGPHESNTERVLKILEDYNIKANFFVVGRNVKKYPTLVEKTASLGHAIGGHSMTHASLDKLSFDSAKKEIDQTFDIVKSILSGVDPFFRFPYGARTKALRAYLSENNISDFFWNVDTLDWKYKDPDVLLKYALEQTTKTGRGIVLFHDVQPQTSAILPEYLNTLANSGYSTVVYEPQ